MRCAESTEAHDSSPFHSLEDVTVVQQGGSVAARYCSKLLSLFGARVVVADTGSARSGQATDTAQGRARAEALTTYLDATQADGRMPAPASIDVVIRDREAGTSAASIDAEFAHLQGANPRLAYVVLSPFGADGPWANRTGDDLAMQAAGGLSAQIGRSGEKPLSVPYELVGLTQGLHAANAVLLARLAPAGSAPAALIDVSGSATIASYNRMYTHIYTFYGWPAVRTGARAPGSGGQYPMTILPCRDGHVVMMSRSREQWARYLEMMGNPSWAEDPELRDPAIIARHHEDRVDALVTSWLMGYTTAELTILAQRWGVPLAPLRSVPEVLTDPQFAHRRFFAPAPSRPHVMLPTFPAVFKGAQ